MSQDLKKHSIGIDIGSTTVKMVVLDSEGTTLFSDYKRHNADIRRVLIDMLLDIKNTIGDFEYTIAITGSGGLKISEKLETPFIQEVIAETAAVKASACDVDCVIELGGEDAKIIFLTNGIEQRMNGICAGGTGSFIDQMASLLQTDAAGLNELAKSANRIYPIAARCGVFAKSDIQPLINDGVSKSDLAASIFQAVVNQTISGLACGRKIKGKVAFLGGPLSFLSELRLAFEKSLNLDSILSYAPRDAHLFPAIGAALSSKDSSLKKPSYLIEKLNGLSELSSALNVLDPLFITKDEYDKFIERQNAYRVNRGDLKTYQGKIYLGIDAGSTTSKVCLVGEDAELLYSFYDSNFGDPINTIKKAFAEIKAIRPDLLIAHACSTGYGEALLKDAFLLDFSEVETIAHATAAKHFKPDLDAILDIGGQDMKFIKIVDGAIDDILLNEACSSGCGSFIENFANSLGYTACEFANLALESRRPIDLGTRCTVFMNSNVKQAQKEGADVSDISSGLCYSVVKNALFKVIKLTAPSDLGKTVVVQGGTFANNAILRAFELVSGVEVVRPDIAGLMGAYGAALLAKKTGCESSTMLSLDEIINLEYRTNSANCTNCSNHCHLTVNLFSSGIRHISGNRCENSIMSSGSKSNAPNLFNYKRNRLFSYEPLDANSAKRGTIGIPRVLNMYEDYPFWAVFFKTLGFRVELSPFSSREIFNLGMDSIPSESECYPAKLAHGHIEWLIKQGITRVFYPCVYYEHKEFGAAQNNYNCPMVTSYPENIKNNIEGLESKIDYYNPFLSFASEKILRKELTEFMEETFGVPKSETALAVKKAWRELIFTRRDIAEEGQRALDWIRKNKAHGIVLAGRPYHIDPEINHGIPEMIQSYGFAVLTEDCISGKSNYGKLRVTDQWMYHSRLYAAASFVAKHKSLNLVQLNSFGCGLDAITTDQVHDILKNAKKLYTLLKIDEVNHLGSAKIRIRSLISAIKEQEIVASKKEAAKPFDFKRLLYTKDMQEEKYTLLATDMSPAHFTFIEAAMRGAGYNVVLLKNEGHNVLDMGVKYVNNDACFPAMIVTGQVMDAVLSGKYNTDKLAVLMAQTGGGCRASNYVGFIRKALKDAGYDNIPVISCNANGLEPNPGFKLKPKMVLRMVIGVIYGDIFMKVMLKTRPYEKIAGSVDSLYESLSKAIAKDLLRPGIHPIKFYKNCKLIIDSFDKIELKDNIKKPKVGLVGEVLVKFMPLANNHLVNLLESEGAEVISPELLPFLESCFWNATYRADHLGRNKLSGFLSKTLITTLEFIKHPISKFYKKSTHFDPSAKFTAIKKASKKVLQLGNHSGEGWFLPGEIIELIDSNINNIICVQPFGCLPNHIVGKGVFKKIKELYPEANMAAIDYDPSASEVNQLNRIKLMLENAEF